MSKQHHYAVQIKWTGNLGEGTANYRGYDRSHTIAAENKVEIAASSDPAFRGDKTKYNPEDLLLASLSSCHMLWYLHLCADAGVIVVDYVDNATGTMAETETGGRFEEVVLHPMVTVKDPSMVDRANELHSKAHKFCFIANSVNFKVRQEPECKVAG